MRNAIMAIVLIFIVATLNCGQAVNDQAAKNKAIVMEAVDALNNHEYEKLEQIYAQDFKRYCQATPEVTVESFDDFKALLAQWDKEILRLD